MHIAGDRPKKLAAFTAGDRPKTIAAFTAGDRPIAVQRSGSQPTISNAAGDRPVKLMQRVTAQKKQRHLQRVTAQER